jgi:methylated-DNA-[protein]-cysteine S-methyltransferase
MEALFFNRVPSPLGELRLVWDHEDRVRALDFDGYDHRMTDLLRRHYGAAGEGYRLTDARVPADIVDRLAAYFGGNLDALDTIAVESRGTPFQRRVWSALRGIPSGTTTNYGALAAVLGCAGASRAVGAANGANPIAIIVPCHRVIGANGMLTGYGGGIDRKRWLLAHERADFSREQPTLLL